MAARTVAVAVTVFAATMLALAIHHTLVDGTCSTTGFTRYGPAPVCSASEWWTVALPVSMFLVLAGGMIGLPNLFALIGLLFLAVGLGALTTSPDRTADTPPASFLLVFGGGFALVGAVVLAVPVWSFVRARRPMPPARWIVLAGGGGVLGVVAAVGVASLIPDDRVTGRPATVVPAPNAAGARYPELAPDDPASLYRPDRLAFALTVARHYVGRDGRIRSLRVEPGGLLLDVSFDDGRKRRFVSVDSSGGYLRSPTTPQTSSPRTFPLSAIDPSVPATLNERGTRPAAFITARADASRRPEWQRHPPR